MPLTLQEQVALALNGLLEGAAPKTLGVAVSGGSDSSALLRLLVGWSKDRGSEIQAVTVDHGLRPESGAEAHGVARTCEKLGLSHEILRWQGWNGAKNMQDQARRARYGLMAEWAAKQGISHVALGHTMDDQAETVLMRLARGAGVDGLSAMAPHRTFDGVIWLRPLLQIRRSALRDYLAEIGADWVDDPGNLDPKYDRIKMRNALGLLDGLGISVQGLADTATRMRSARNALEQATYDAAKELVEIRAGAVFMDIAGFFSHPAEIRRRVLAHIVSWIASTPYPPRGPALTDLERRIRAGGKSTLHGCLIATRENICTLSREPGAVRNVVAAPGEIWDKRWRLHGPYKAGQQVRMLGENGLKHCTDWRETGLERAVLLASPGVWRGEHLLAAPLAGFGNGWRAELIQNENHFASTILSH